MPAHCASERRIRPRHGREPSHKTALPPHQMLDWGEQVRPLASRLRPTPNRSTQNERWIDEWFAAHLAEGGNPDPYRREIRQGVWDRFLVWMCLRTVTRWHASHASAGLVNGIAQFDRMATEGQAQRSNNYEFYLPEVLGQFKATEDYVDPDTIEARAQIAAEPESADEVELIPATPPPVSAYRLEELAARASNRRHRAKRRAEADRVEAKRAITEETAAREEQRAKPKADADVEDAAAIQTRDDEDTPPRQNVQPEPRQHESLLDSWAATRAPILAGWEITPAEQPRTYLQQLKMVLELDYGRTSVESTRAKPVDPQHTFEEQLASIGIIVAESSRVEPEPAEPKQEANSREVMAAREPRRERAVRRRIIRPRPGWS